MKILKERLNQICKKDKIDNKIEALESDKKLLQQQITTPAQQDKETQQHYYELEQYGRRYSLWIDSVPRQNNKKAGDVFKFVKGLIEEVPDLETPEAEIDRVHSIELVLIIPTGKLRKSVSLLSFALRPSVIVQHFTEPEGL